MDFLRGSGVEELDNHQSSSRGKVNFALGGSRLVIINLSWLIYSCLQRF